MSSAAEGGPPFMPRLRYSNITSLDGYIADEAGNFAWGMPDAETHAFINDQERAVGLCLYGRRMYETMVAWETMPLDGEPDAIRDYAQIWRAADKIVYSTALPAVTSERTRLERSLELDDLRAMKAGAATDLSIGGPHLAAPAIRAGLVDDFSFLVCPVVVGGGTPVLPAGGRLDLELMSERQFANGMVHLGYRRRA